MKLFKKTAPQNLAPPGPTNTHIHQHRPSATGPIFAWAAVIIAGLLIAWFSLLYLIDAAGAPNPEQTLAQALIWIFILLGLLFLLQHWFGQFLDRRYQHRETLEQERTKQIRYKQLMAQTAITDTRTTGQRQRLASLIYIIMLDAYDHHAKNGPYPGTWRPWSRRAAGERVLLTLGETDPVGPEFGARVRRFLAQHEVIKNDQLNLADYPDLAAVQRLLYQPVLLESNNSQTGGGGSNWSIIE